MRHAGPQDLNELAALLETIRAKPGVVEPREGYFYCRGRALVHFHADPSGLFADARVGRKWSRVRVTEAKEKVELLDLLEGEIRARW